MTRMILTAALVCSMAVSAFADKKGEVADTGTTRSIQLKAPEVSATTASTAAGAPERERGPSATPAQQRVIAPLSGALQMMIERQMRKNQPSIDSCVAEELQRNPQANGEITLAITIAERKVTTSGVVADTVNSSGLRACLLKSSRTWLFSTKGADFTWPVAVRKR